MLWKLTTLRILLATLSPHFHGARASHAAPPPYPRQGGWGRCRRRRRPPDDLAKAIGRAGDADLILTATESSDGYTGVVPEQIAELLGLPSVTFAKSIVVDGQSVNVQRQTESGYDEVTCPLPAVVSVTAGVVEPRYPSFKGIMAAKSKPVDQLTLTVKGTRQKMQLIATQATAH